MTLHIDFYTFSVTGSNLRCTAKRYTSGCSGDGLTLLFAHSLGSHKEQWEPTIEHIFHLQQGKDKKDHIREAWAIDWQGHGDAAVINASVLDSRKEVVSTVEWALALEFFVKSHLRGHRIVALGHSAGTCAIMLSMKNFPVSKPPYIAVFLVEPTIMSQELFDAHAKERQDFGEVTMKVTLNRVDSWPTREAAASYLRKRLPWKSWDSRVFDIYIKHGLQTIPTPDGEVVCLKANKRQEGMAYLDFPPYFESVVLFRERCMVIPFHIIFGENIDLVPRYIQEALSDPSQGLKPMSVTRVSDAGHLIVQENPNALAAAICNRLDNTAQQMKSNM